MTAFIPSTNANFDYRGNWLVTATYQENDAVRSPSNGNLT